MTTQNILEKFKEEASKVIDLSNKWANAIPQAILNNYAACIARSLNKNQAKGSMKYRSEACKMLYSALAEVVAIETAMKNLPKIQGVSLEQVKHAEDVRAKMLPEFVRQFSILEKKAQKLINPEKIAISTKTFKQFKACVVKIATTALEKMKLCMIQIRDCTNANTWIENFQKTNFERISRRYINTGVIA